MLQESTAEKLTINNPGIVSLVQAALQLQDYALLADLYTEYTKSTFSTLQQEFNQNKLNRLLVESAQENNIRAVKELVKFGADINHLGILNTTDNRSVECYFLDMLVYWNNFTLFELLGVNNFNLGIYQDKQSKNQSVRLLCSSLFCSWVIQHHRLDILTQLKNKCLEAPLRVYNWRIQKYWHACSTELQAKLFFKPNSSLRIVNEYEKAINNTGQNHYWNDKQIYLDLNFNLPLAIYGTQWHLYSRPKYDFIRILNNNNISAQNLSAMLSKHFWLMESPRALMFILLPMGIFAFAIGVNNATQSNPSPEGYILLIGGSISVLFGLFEAMRTAATCGARGLSCGKLEIFGSSDTIAIRLCTNVMIKEILESRSSSELIEQDDRKIRNHRNFFGFQFQRYAQLPIETNDIELQSLRSKSAGYSVTI